MTYTPEDLADSWGDSATCGTAILLAVLGECADGMDFIFYSTGHNTEVRYFQDGQFVAFATQSDSQDITCKGQEYWPAFVECSGATVTEVLCGTSYEVGDTPSLPWNTD